MFRCCLSSLLFFYGVYMLAHTFVCAYTHVCVGHRITSGVPQELSHHVFKCQFLNSPELAHLARLTASPRDLPVSIFPVLGLSVHAIILIFLVLQLTELSPSLLCFFPELNMHSCSQDFSTLYVFGHRYSDFRGGMPYLLHVLCCSIKVAVCTNSTTQCIS